MKKLIYITLFDGNPDSVCFDSEDKAIEYIKSRCGKRPIQSFGWTFSYYDGNQIHEWKIKESELK